MLAGKTAVIVGCSAQGGTGWAIAEALAAAGVTPIVAARSLDPLQELARRTRGHAARCDVGEAAQVAALAHTAGEILGGIDIAVNAAGLPVQGLIADSDAQTVQAALDINYLGNVHFIKHMAAVMRNNGSIVLISSLSTTRPMLPYFAYACAKAATDCLVRYAALEYGCRGIRVNSVLPGPIRSELARELFAQPGVAENFAREIPLGRVGVPADYADIVLWLSGPAFVTGLNIPVSGGNQLTRLPRPDELAVP